jgi:predicted dehydrogenase
MVKEVSRYGVNIALQKPIATTLEDAIEILKTVDRAGIRLYLLWQMRQDPQNIKIKNIIDQGVLGRVLYFRRKHCLSTHRWPDFKSSWHVKKEMNIGMWADDASHPIDLVRWYFGMPQSVYADIDTLVDCKIPDDNGIAIFRYKDGLFAEVMCSFTSDFGETTTEINGTEGCLIQYYGDAPSCNQKADHECSLKWKRYGDADWNTCPIQTPKHHTQRIRDLVPSILNFAKNNFTPPSPEEYMDTLKMTLMCYESSMIKKQLLI